MRKAIFALISIIFIASAILLVFSLPQCGHNNFELGPITGHTANSCNGNIYDQHMAFLQTVFLTKLEWIFLLLAITLIFSLSFFTFPLFILKAAPVCQSEKSKKYFYHQKNQFEYLSPILGHGRIWQRLLE